MAVGQNGCKGLVMSNTRGGQVSAISHHDVAFALYGGSDTR